MNKKMLYIYTSIVLATMFSLQASYNPSLTSPATPQTPSWDPRDSFQLIEESLDDLLKEGLEREKILNELSPLQSLQLNEESNRDREKDTEEEKLRTEEIMAQRPQVNPTTSATGIKKPKKLVPAKSKSKNARPSDQYTQTFKFTEE